MHVSVGSVIEEEQKGGKGVTSWAETGVHHNTLARQSLLRLCYGRQAGEGDPEDLVWPNPGLASAGWCRVLDSSSPRL